MDKSKLTIVKIGGKLINDPEQLDLFLEVFDSLKAPKILVHGGGRKATDLSQQLGIEVHMIDGRRITDKDTLDIAVMVYAGLINKNIVARLQGKGTNALGLSGADGNAIQSHKRIIEDLDYGFVGDVDFINGPFLKNLLEAGICPVFSPITHNAKGILLNTNADTIASRLAIDMQAYFDVELSFCFEYPGVMKDLTSSQDYYHELYSGEFKALKEEDRIHSGMLPKLKNAFDAAASGVSCVRICGIENLTIQNSGTRLFP